MNHLIPATIQRQLWNFGALKLRFWGAHYWLAIDSWTLQFKVRALYFTGHIRVRASSDRDGYSVQLGHWDRRCFQCLDNVGCVPCHDLVHEIDARIGGLAQSAVKASDQHRVDIWA